MAQTVVGFFDNSSEAQRAVEQLQQRGISRDRIDISSGRNSGSAQVSSDRGESGNGISNFFRDLFGGDNDESDRYTRVGNSADSIVTVHAQSRDEAEMAADLLDDCGAIDVDERASGYSNASNLSSGTMSRSEETSIPRVQEDLEVGKRSVETGGVRVRSRIVERPVEEHIRLREENVQVERTPVNRLASSDELNNFQNADIELTERAEVPVVHKEARVVEEIRVSKEVSEHDETIRDTVRDTEIDVERQEGRTQRNTGRDETGTGRGIL